MKRIFFCMFLVNILCAQDDTPDFDNKDMRRTFEKLIGHYFKKETLEQYGQNFVVGGKINGVLFVTLIKSKDIEVKHRALRIILDMGNTLLKHTDSEEWIAIRDAIIDLMNSEDADLRQSAILTARVFWRNDKDKRLSKTLIHHLDDNDEESVAYAIQGLRIAQDDVLKSDDILGKLRSIAMNDDRPIAQGEAVKFFIYLVDELRSPKLQ